MITIRSFRSKVFVALVAVALVPAGVAIVTGTFVLREVVSTSGTAGPWQSVAESGRTLLDSVEAAGIDEPAVRDAARRHRAALSESVRLSRLYAYVADRFLDLLPLLAIGTVVAIAALSFVTARFMSRIFSRPIQELVAWTRRIGRGEALPGPDEVEPADVREFEQLRDALRSMAGELREARERAVESARLRSWTEMARGVAHEIKNPLTPMRMAARTVVSLDDPRAADAGEVLLEEIDRLDEMARSFSQLGRMPEGPTSRVDVPELLEELIAPYRDGPVEISLETSDDVLRVQGWYDALQRVFRNLLVNAWEAARSGEEEGGTIRVGIARRDDDVEVEIRDTGPGIPRNALSQIWDPDFTTKRSGTGLGLPLVRQAVRAHGGRVTAGNADGGGAVFRVRLPISGPPDPAGAPDEVPEEPESAEPRS